MSRRAFVAGLGCLLGGPSVVRAQQAGKVWTLGLFHVGLDHVPPGLPSFREDLTRLGYQEGKNVVLDWRNLADEAAARATARDFVRKPVDLIVAFENQAVRAAQAATSSIPVVFLHVTDPVAEGFIKSLAHPGANLTGVADYFGELQGKRLELFQELVPGLRRVLTLTDPTDPAMSWLSGQLADVARRLKLELLRRTASTESDIVRVFGSLKEGEADGVFIAAPNLLTKFPALILRLALEHRLPVAYQRKDLVGRGALFSYGPDYAAVGRDAAQYVHRIVKGARPADLPVQQASRLELVINLKTARALGLTIPQSVLLRADDVVQ